MKKFIVLILFVAVGNSYANFEQLASNKRWHLLLHYKKGFWGGYSSTVDKGHFFFDPRGNISPEKELLATIKAFQSIDYDKKKFQWHPQCAFPARFKFIKENTKLDFPEIQCSDLKWWESRLNAKGLSLVFSSYYNGNPASMFGHTLLKFNTNLAEGKISDFTFNYAANVGEDKGLTYIIKGLSGGFDGVFSTDPYYVKINDYVQGESRDVWEYQLDLSADELDWVVKHAWEVKTNALFDYYFLDENCSYFLLTILDVANPDWNTSRGFYFYTLPVTTIKRAYEANIVKNVVYRPSFRKKMLERVEVLSEKQRQEYFKILADKEYLKKVKDKRVSEAYIAYLRYKQYEQGDDGELIKSIKKDLRFALVHRARQGGKTEPIEDRIVQKNLFDNPLYGHDSFAVAFDYGRHSRFEEFVDFKFRFGVHDIMSNGLGLPRYSNIEVLSFKPRYYFETKKLVAEEVVFVDLFTLQDFDSITKEMSWGIRAELMNPKDFLTLNPILNIRPRYGIGKLLFNQKLALYSYLFTDFAAGNLPLGQTYRLAPGLSLGAMGYFTDSFKYRINLSIKHDFLSENDLKTFNEASINLGYSLEKNLELHSDYSVFESSVNKNERYSELKITGNIFF